MNIFRLGAGIGLLTCLSFSAVAQTAAPADPPPLEPLAKQVASRTCPARAKDLVQALDAKQVFDARPPDLAKVCACTERGIVNDAQLASHFALGGADRSQRLASEATKAYFTTRMYQALFACLATELDLSLRVFPLSR